MSARKRRPDGSHKEEVDTTGKVIYPTGPAKPGPTTFDLEINLKRDSLVLVDHIRRGHATVRASAWDVGGVQLAVAHGNLNVPMRVDFQATTDTLHFKNVTVSDLPEAIVASVDLSLFRSKKSGKPRDRHIVMAIGFTPKAPNTYSFLEISDDYGA